MVKISEVEIVEFTFAAKNLGVSADNARAIYNLGYQPGGTSDLTKYAVVIRSDDGGQGEFVVQWGGTPASMAQSLLLAVVAASIAGIYPAFRMARISPAGALRED